MFPIILALVTLTLPVAARDTGQWENQPIYLRQWFQKLMQPDNPDMSCYGEPQTRTQPQNCSASSVSIPISAVSTPIVWSCRIPLRSVSATQA
jgi:hypothetical protein